jgi:hypothetical protein
LFEGTGELTGELEVGGPVVEIGEGCVEGIIVFGVHQLRVRKRLDLYPEEYAAVKTKNNSERCSDVIKPYANYYTRYM